MKFSRILVAAAATAAAGLAQAGPQSLGSGPGTYSFSDNHDRGYYVTLGPGSYTFDSEVVASGFDLITVWLSYSPDHNPGGPRGNDNDTFDEITSLDGREHYPPVVTTPPGTGVYVDINTPLGNLTNGQFNGRLVVPQVPEPAGVALLAAGLGLLGFVGKRRRG